MGGAVGLGVAAAVGIGVPPGLAVDVDVAAVAVADGTCAVVGAVAGEFALPIAMSTTKTDPPMMPAFAFPDLRAHQFGPPGGGGT